MIILKQITDKLQNGIKILVRSALSSVIDQNMQNIAWLITQKQLSHLKF